MNDVKEPVEKLKPSIKETYVEWINHYPLQNRNDLEAFCWKSRNIFGMSTDACKDLLFMVIKENGKIETAYQLSLIDKDTYVTQLLLQGKYQEAYQKNLIDKSEYTQWHKKKLLDDGKIIEAYELGYIDKNTADLYLQKQKIEQQDKQTREQQAYQKRQLEQQRQQLESEESRDSYNRAINSINNLGNQLNQNAYNTTQSSNSLQNTIDANNQRKQDKKTNYQLQQINNNLNGIRYGY